jgi:hypothetical protein
MYRPHIVHVLNDLSLILNQSKIVMKFIPWGMSNKSERQIFKAWQDKSKHSCNIATENQPGLIQMTLLVLIDSKCNLISEGEAWIFLELGHAIMQDKQETP